MEVLVITLCMYLAGCSTIESFYAWIKRSNRLFFIKNVKQSYLGIIKVPLIQKKCFTYTNTTVAAALRAKKE